MQKFEQSAVLGAGVIGSSWASLFLAAGQHVHVYEPTPDGEQKVRAYVENAWPTLERLGLTEKGDPDQITFHGTEIEPHLPSEAIVASSASGLMVNEMQQGWQNPSRFIVAHPFNPPHLIPLVELVTNDKTAEGILEAAEEFYQQVGKVTIRLQKEVPGHVANRLQAALWREAIYLVESGVASVEDVDKAVWAGPGLRWAAMGPTSIFNLAAGPAGLEEYCKRYSESFHRWWADLGEVTLDEDTGKMLAAGVEAVAQGKDVAALAAERDELIISMLQGTLPLRKDN